jgi:hypothetical protein
VNSQRISVIERRAGARRHDRRGKKSLSGSPLRRRPRARRDHWTGRTGRGASSQLTNPRGVLQRVLLADCRIAEPRASHRHTWAAHSLDVTQCRQDGEHAAAVLWRVVRSHFVKVLAMWLSTLLPETTGRSAIVALDLPWAISPWTSRSRSGGEQRLLREWARTRHVCYLGIECRATRGDGVHMARPCRSRARGAGYDGLTIWSRTAWLGFHSTLPACAPPKDAGSIPPAPPRGVRENATHISRTNGPPAFQAGRSHGHPRSSWRPTLLHKIAQPSSDLWRPPLARQ